MPLQHRCNWAHSLHVVMAPLLTGSLTFIATIPYSRYHNTVNSKINDSVKHLPSNFCSAVTVARRTLSYVSRRPSFLTPSRLFNFFFNSIFYLFLPPSVSVTLHCTVKTEIEHFLIFTVFLHLICTPLFYRISFAVHYFIWTVILDWILLTAVYSIVYYLQQMLS